jgi:transposase
MRDEYKAKAILLRKQGKTYREILIEIPIAKSTLSDWLRSVELSKPQKQRYTQLRKEAALRGASTSLV